VTSRVNLQDIRSFALPNLTKNDLGNFHELLAMQFYLTSTSFARIEESHLLAAIQKRRPEVTLPSRKDLAGKYLHMCYHKVKVKVNVWPSRNSFNCLKSDSWSNVKHEAVMNYMLLSADTSLFLESNYTGEQGLTAAILASDMSRVIKATSGKISGVTMDKTTANKSA
jgi:hypothetical protein